MKKSKNCNRNEDDFIRNFLLWKLTKIIWKYQYLLAQVKYYYDNMKGPNME